MGKKLIKILLKKVGKDPEVIEIRNTLEEKQRLVGGLIEVIPYDDLLLICNEEGKLLNLPPNLIFEYDYIAGDCFLAGDDFENGDFYMTPEEHSTFSQQMDEMSKKLDRAELTIQEGIAIAYNAVQTAQEYEDQQYYEEYPYQDPKKQEKEKEKYRDPAFYAPEGYDQEMFHEWQPSSGKKK